MICINTKQIDLKVTPNHNLFVGSSSKRSHPKHFKFKKSCDVYGKNVIMTRSVDNWVGNDCDIFVLPECRVKTTGRHSENNGFKIEPQKIIPMENWLKFFGWYVTEGSLYKNSINISQQKEFNFDEIKQSFVNLDLNRKIQTNTNNGRIDSFSIKCVQLSEYLKKFGKSHEKYIPKNIKSLPKKYLKILLNVMLKGDGTTILKYNSNKFYARYYSKSKKLIEDVQEVALKCGYSSTFSHPKRSDDEYTVSISDSKTTQINLCTERKNPVYSEKHYNGKVYCCEVPNSVILVRRNGKIIWCGNSKCMDGEMFRYFNKNDDVRITDLHQGIVWGCQTEETRINEDLINRFDWEGDFGTVIHRFLMQSQVGHPLTVHGSGGQTRAFIHIQDTVKCIKMAVENPPAKEDRVKIFNQTTECLNIRELALKVADMTGAEVRYYKNPRNEDDKNDLKFCNDAFLSLGLKPITLDDGLLTEIAETAFKYKDRCDLSKIICTSTWRNDITPDFEGDEKP